MFNRVGVKQINSKKSDNKILDIYLWALSFLSPYRSKFALLIFFIIIISFIQLSIPKFVQYFIDSLIPNNNMSLFYSFLLILAILLTFMIIIQGYNNILKIRIMENVSKDIQFSLFEHSRKLGFQYYETHPVGETLALLNSEVSALQRLYRDFIPRMLNWSILSIISIILMFTIHPYLFLTAIPCLLLYYLIGPKFVKKGALYSRENSDNRVQLNQIVYENISGLYELKSNMAETWGLKRLLDVQSKWGKSYIGMVFYGYSRFAIRNLSFYLGFVLTIIVGYYLVENNKVSVGGMTAFLLYYFDAMKRITGVIGLITEQQILMIQAKKIYNFAKIKPFQQEIHCKKEIKVKGEVLFENVSFAYTASSTKVINNLNLRILPGEKVALIGKSGSGKSTLLKLLGRFYEPSGGDIYIDGVPINKFNLEQLRSKTMGFVFQETYLFGATIRENIAFGNPAASEEEIIKAAKAAFAHDFITTLPHGYNTYVGERGVKLSGGQKQRISLARMFLKNPSILILDEATSALDNVSEVKVYQALQNLCNGRTTIIIAHRIAPVINLIDKILVLEQGKIIETGTHEELLKHENLYYQLYKGGREIG